MSAITRITQIFSIFGVGSTIPLTTIFTKDQIKTNSEGVIRQIKEEVPIAEEKEDIQKGEVMQAVKKMMDKGDPQCFWLPHQEKTGLEFLMCVYSNKLTTPYLFHYDVNNQLKKGKQVRQVQQITYDSRPKTIRFKNGWSVDVPRSAKLYLTTRLLRSNITLIPESQCKVTGNQRNYKLFCSEKEVGEVHLMALHENNHQTISR